jgi:hypothetical protein
MKIMSTWTQRNPGLQFALLLAAAVASSGLAAAPLEPLPAGALSADQNAPAYAGYYTTWTDPWFDAAGKSPDQVYAASQLARIPADYTHVMIAFAQPDFAWSGIAANTWAGTGVDFSSSPQSVKAAIDVLHSRKMKVILSVGGATYYNWAALAAEGVAGHGTITTALTKIMTDMGFDGLDVDYELDANIDTYANASKAMRNAVDAAGGGRILAVAAFSTGADCTAATTADKKCAGKISYWGGNAGRERQLVDKYPTVAAGFDMVNVMSYDAQTQHYDGVVAWKQYRALFKKSTIVSIGLETAPEGWPGGMLVVGNADAQCTGSRIVQDQYGKALDVPYSVQRYTAAVKNSTSPKHNPRDGAMLWEITKHADTACGSAKLATPGTIGPEVVTTLGGVNDPLVKQAPWY